MVRALEFLYLNLMSPLAGRTDLVPRPDGALVPVSKDLTHTKTMDIVSSETTPQEFDDIVLNFLRSRVKNVDKTDKAFMWFRDAILYVSVFASAPATFDELAVGNIILPSLPEAKNLGVLCNLLEDFGAFEFVSEVPGWRVEMAEAWVGNKIKERFGESTLPMSKQLLDLLSQEVKEMTTSRYRVQPNVKQKLSDILSKYEE